MCLRTIDEKCQFPKTKPLIAYKVMFYEQGGKDHGGFVGEHQTEGFRSPQSRAAKEPDPVYRKDVRYRSTLGRISGSFANPEAGYPCGFHAYVNLEDARSFVDPSYRNKKVVRVKLEGVHTSGAQAGYNSTIYPTVVAKYMTIEGIVQRPRAKKPRAKKPRPTEVTADPGQPPQIA